VILIPLIALLIGAFIALAIHLPAVPGVYGQYLAVACLAGFDTVCGGIRAGLEDKFRREVFTTGFVSNVVIASFIAWFGEQIYINLFLAVALVLGARIFTNLSLIRRYGLTKFQDARDRRRLQMQAQTQAVASAQPEPNP
jgi:small basic protein